MNQGIFPHAVLYLTSLMLIYVIIFPFFFPCINLTGFTKFVLNSVDFVL